jgi:hypothetical protein
MATGSDVLNMLLPEGGWIISGDDFDGITWVDERPRCTEAEFIAGFAQYDSWKAEQDAEEATAKTAAQAKLAALGLTTDDLKALGLGGN